MHKKVLYFTAFNQIICLSVILYLVIIGKNVEAQGQPQAFLEPIFYGQTTVTAVFDHNLPIPGDGDTDTNEFVIHYDGSQHEPVNGVIPGGFGYDQHEGIDYGLHYRVVLAAADGTVRDARWANEENHRAGLGLHVVIRHDNDYSTRYGHLSAVVVRQNEEVIANPATREGIIGISGNTGNVIGANNCDPDTDPLCGTHLHFELRDTDHERVNPYGWIAQGEDDPWETESGAASEDLWLSYPAITTNQYLTSTAINELAVNNARITIDNSHDFVASSCWNLESNNDGFGGSYYWVEGGDGASDCAARWTVPADAFTQPGAYDVYAYAPASATSLQALHRTYHNNAFHDAIVVQDAYPNTSHDGWVFIGRHDFAMDGSERIVLRSDTIDSDVGNRIVADAIRLAPAFTSIVTGTVSVSANSTGGVGGVAFSDEDILAYDARHDVWSMVFDGADVLPAATDVNAFHLMDDGSILMSFDTPTAVTGLGTVDDSDIVRFTPTSLGQATAGTFSLYKSAAGLGLNPNDDEMDIDAIGFTPDDRLLISVVDDISLAGSSYRDMDLLVFEEGSGLSLYFDASDVSLIDPSEDVNGVWVDSDTGDIYLSTLGTFDVGDSDGDGADVFVCHPISTGANTNCSYGPGLYWNGGAHGFGSMVVDGFFVEKDTSLPDAEILVAQSSDDAGPYAADTGPAPCSASHSAYAINHNEIYFGHCPDDTGIVSGFRFTNIPVPKDALIEQAQLAFTVDGPYTEVLGIELRGGLLPNTSTFDGTNRPDTLTPLTQAAVSWNISGLDEWNTFETRLSPDLTGIIQEIVNQNDWASGNALTIVVQPQPTATPNGDRRVFAWDREQSTLRSARLQVWYVAP